MQHQLRNLLEHKAAIGGDYYFDMNDPNVYGHHGGYEYDNDYENLIAGDLIAGARRRRHRRVGRGGKKPAYMVKGSPAAKKHMAKIRKMRGHGGDLGFIDLDDLNCYQGGVGQNKRRKRIEKLKSAAQLRGYKNPIEKAQIKQYKDEKEAEWLRTVGPEYSAKLIKKADMLNKALYNSGMLPVGREYNTRYNAALDRYAPYKPITKAAAKFGVKPTFAPVANPAAWPARADAAAIAAEIAAYNAIV